MKKYKLTGVSILYNGHKLYRIECINAFDNVKVGDKGGWLEKEDNLDASGNAWVHDNAKVFGNACVSGNACVYGDACVSGNAKVYGNAWVSGNACVSGNAKVSGDAEINSDCDYMVFKNNWSSGRYFTWTKSNNMWQVGCFYGTGEELIKKAYGESELKGRCYEKVVNFVKELEEIKNNC